MTKKSFWLLCFNMVWKYAYGFFIVTVYEQGSSTADSMNLHPEANLSSPMVVYDTSDEDQRNYNIITPPAASPVYHVKLFW